MVGGRNGWFIKESEVVKSVGMQRDRGNWFHFSVSLYSVAKSTAGLGAGWGRRFGANVVLRVSQASFSQPKKKKKKKKSSRQGNETSIVPSSCLQASELQ